MFSLRDRPQEGRGRGRKARKGKGKGASLPAKRAIMVGSSSGFNVKFTHKWSNYERRIQAFPSMPTSWLFLTNTRQ